MNGASSAEPLDTTVVLFNRDFCYIPKSKLDLNKEKVEVLTQLTYDGETFVANKGSNLASVILNVRYFVQGLLYRKQDFDDLVSSSKASEAKQALAIERISMDIQFTKEDGEIMNTKFSDI